MNVNNNSSNISTPSQMPAKNTSSEGLSTRVALVALGVICAIGGMIAASARDMETAGMLFSCSFVCFAGAAIASIDVNESVCLRRSHNSIYIFEDKSPVIVLREPSRISPYHSFNGGSHLIPGGMGREARPIERPRPESVIRGSSRISQSFDGNSHVVPGGRGLETRPERSMSNLDRPLDRDEHALVGRSV